MAAIERQRDVLPSPPGPDYWKARTREGWKLAAIEWMRETEPAGAPESGGRLEEVPFGMRVAGDCEHLEENAAERQIMLLAMELIADDLPLSRVAEELNRRGFRTRRGTAWGPESVFDLLPRLIEAGPGIVSSREWEARRERTRHAG